MKGSKRRTAILASAAPIFNRNGFAGTSIAEILKATALEKGGLYNHFTSKEELALASFDYAWQEVNAYFKRTIHDAPSGAAKIHAYVDSFERYALRPVVDGGCPLANAAIEADDALPFLRDRVREAFRQLHSFVSHHVQRAVERKEFRPGVDPAAAADFIVASLEGALLLSRALRSRESLHRTIDTLRTWLQSLT